MRYPSASPQIVYFAHANLIEIVAQADFHETMLVSYLMLRKRSL
ncbi:MAG: hypothetical protein HZRFUVUK_000273 [Candidatus Fervidibacterota bacterium]|jgi:hypothetical protein